MLQIDKIENSCTFELCFVCEKSEPDKKVFAKRTETPQLTEIFVMHGKCVPKFREDINAK
jgi:hypothetical protein